MVVLVADAVHVTLVLVRVLTVRVLAVVVPVLVVLVSLVVVAVLVMLVVLVVLVTCVLAVIVRAVVVLVTLMLAVAMLVIAMLMHAVTVLVVAMRVIVFVSQVRLLVPEHWHKHLAKSMAQQVAADKHAPGLFLRFVTRNRPRTLYQVKLDPLITTRQRTLCARELSKNTS